MKRLAVGAALLISMTSFSRAQTAAEHEGHQTLSREEGARNRILCLLSGRLDSRFRANFGEIPHWGVLASLRRV